MANDYVTINNSTGTYLRRFRAASMRMTSSRAQDLQDTINGGFDLTMGAVYTRINLVLYVPYIATDINDGSYNDLTIYYGYNDPGGAPSNQLQFTDYFGTTHTCYMIGDIQADPLCGEHLDDSESFYICPVELIYENSGKPT